MGETKRKVVDITSDGTLIVNTRHYDMVKRIVIKYSGCEPKVFIPELSPNKGYDERIMNTFLADSRK